MDQTGVWRAGAGARGCGPHCPPVPRKDPARDEASEALWAGQRELLWAYKDPAAAQEERGVAAIFAGSVSMKFGE